MASPRPEHPALKKLKGNPGKRQIAPVSVEAVGEPFSPEHLSEDAKACVEVIRQAMPPGLYTRVDSFALASFATAWALHKAASALLAEKGAIATGSQGQPVQAPWINILNEQARIMASIGDRLGLDPKSRAALALPKDKPKSKFDGLMAGAAKAH